MSFFCFSHKIILDFHAYNFIAKGINLYLSMGFGKKIKTAVHDILNF